MQEDKHPEWYESWFDSLYYHLLYSNRDMSEAELFINNIIELLTPKKHARVLDLACGKGRHATYLNKKGFDVTGIDLSPQSIEYAKQSETDLLHFYVHDMRKLFRTNYFDIALNLFTSFGYFENDRDDNAVINSVCKALKPGGIFVLDFMNSKKAIVDLVTEETKTINNISFRITKKVENGFIVKRISFTDKGKDHVFEERVKTLMLSDFEKYFEANELKIVNLRGSYKLEEFNENTSDRLIIIGRKE
ncbi:MAG: class I SAM-dependent methyltransferase [Bacteroidetes bacterium]|nr:class I SAM-dependent methyltransferase [Bacteroidota bacterium]